MTIPSPEATAGVSPTGAPIMATIPRREHLVRRVLRNPTAAISLGVLLVIVLLSLLAPIITSASPVATSINDTLGPPAAGHPLGFDSLGRDQFARLLYGGQTSLSSAVIALAVALMIGIPAGLLAGYVRGAFDAIASWLSNLVMAIPAIIVLLVVASRTDAGTAGIMVVLGVLMSPGVYRLVRASVLAVREELYVDAARVAGLSDLRIMRRHILPVVAAPAVILSSQLLGVGVAVQAGLQFLGIGSSGEASWGAMLGDAFLAIYRAPYLLIWPGVAIVVTLTAFALLGNGLRDAMVGGDVKQTRAARRASRRSARPLASGRKTVIEASAAAAAEAVPDKLLVVEDLRIAYPRLDGQSIVVDGVDLAVAHGETLGLVGESGSGKTQTAFAILGLLPPQARVSAQTLFFGGRSLAGISARDMNRLRGKGLAYIPQEPMSNLDPSFTIGFQLTEPLRHHLGLSRAAAKARALELLARVGIPDPQRTFDAYPHEVSGGMAQRVLIAGAVSCDPRLLIADEPTTALDVTVQAEVLDLLRSLQQERKMGLILVTHNFGVVADICDRVAVMKSGRIVEDAPVEQLFESPQHPYTKMLLGSTLEESVPRHPLGSAAGERGVVL